MAVDKKEAATLAQIESLFAARTDVHALGRVNPVTNKARYACVKEPLTTELVRKHLMGELLLGIYPLVDTKVKLFALDLDAPPAEERVLTAEEEFQIAWRDALEQHKVLEQAGLHTYLERSRSGTGVHIWGFFDEWVEASEVRQAIKPLLLRSDTFDRMYPVQDVSNPDSKTPYGNLIALPFHGGDFSKGHSAFYSTDLTPRKISAFEFNTSAVIRRLAASAPKAAVQRSASVPATAYQDLSMGDFEGRPAKLYRSGVLKLISDYGCTFMQAAYKDRARLKEPMWYAAIGQLTAFERGREAAHIFSMGHPQYSPSETDSKFSHALENPPIGCAKIHEDYPHLACKSCPMTAPYRRAEGKLASFIADGAPEMKRGGFGTYLPRVWRFDAGEEEPGIRNMLGELDRFTRFRKGELTVIGAQPSMGKTAIAVHLAMNVARQNLPVKFFSAETGEEGLRNRILGHAAGVDSLLLRGEGNRRLMNEERKRLEEASAELDALPLDLNFTATRPETMLNAIELSMILTRTPFDQQFVAFFDYLQFAAKEKDDASPVERISRVVKELKLLAKVTKGSVVGLSQLIRQSEGETEPSITWFKGSGDVEAEQDVGMVITGERIEGKIAPRAVTIVKQREGQANVRAEFLLDQPTCTFEPVRKVGTQERAPLFGEGDPGYGNDDKQN